MNHNEFINFHKEFLEKMHTTVCAKNKDYAGNSPEDYAFANFKLVESLGVCSIEQGVVVRMCDKISRLATFVKNKEFAVKDENVWDTCADLANYSVILAAIVKAKSSKNRDYNPVDIV